MPPSGNGNRGNGNPFKRNSPSDPNGNQKGNNSGGPQPFWKSPWLWGVLLVVMAVAGFQLFAGAGTQTIDTKDGFALLKTENVAYAKIIDNKQLVQLELKSNFTKTDPDTNKPHNYGKKVQFYYTFAQGAQVVQVVEKADPSKGWTSNMQQTSMVSYLISSILPFIIMIAVFWFLMSRMGGASGMFGMGGKKNNGKLLEGQTPSTKFSDVAGEDSAVQEVEEIKDFLKDPSKYKALGARIPRGVLLYGPPGTGKTLLARAIAGEAGVPFYAMAGSDFVEMFVGLGASRVRDLFDEAKKNAPAIIFIDEIDAVGRKRGSGMSGGHDEREQTLNQLLVEMDGFDSDTNLIIIAATNRPDVLDPALLRPGRFDRQVYVGHPDIKGREAILKVHARNKPLGDDVSLAELAKGTGGFTGADLENLMNEAALLAARRHHRFISMAELNEAVIKVIAGPEKKSRVVIERERKLTAYHEAGHAIVIHDLPTQDPVHEITIIPRGMAGGMTISLPQEDVTFQTRQQLTERIAVCLGGRAAEQLALGDISTGAGNDLQKASAIARNMVTRYGMSEKVGNVVFDSGHDEVFIGRSMAQTKNYSEEVAALIDEEVKALVDGAYARCGEILTHRRRELDIVAEYLLQYENMDAKTFEQVFTDPAALQPPAAYQAVEAEAEQDAREEEEHGVD